MPPVRKVTNPLVRERTGPVRKVQPVAPIFPQTQPLTYQPSCIRGEPGKIGWYLVGSTTGKDPTVFTDRTRFAPEAGPFPHLVQALEYLPWHELDWPRVAMLTAPETVVLLYGWEIMERHWFLIAPDQRLPLHLAS